MLMDVYIFCGLKGRVIPLPMEHPQSLPASWRVIPSGETVVPKKFIILEMKDTTYIPLIYSCHPVVATQTFLADLVRLAVEEAASTKPRLIFVASPAAIIIRKLLERPDAWIQTPDNDVIPLSIHRTWDWGKGICFFIESFPMSFWENLQIGITTMHKYCDNDPHLRSQLSYMRYNIKLLRVFLCICSWNVIKELRPDDGSCPGIFPCHLFTNCICFDR